MPEHTICSIEGCGKPRVTRGWCDNHYYRWRRYGDPRGGRTERSALIAFFNTALGYTGTDCLLWPYAKDQDGYGRLCLDGRLKIASRAICDRVNGPPPTPKHEAAHSCGKGHEGCITPRHLSWKTSAENEADKIVHETRAIGERNSQAKISNAEVLELRALRGTDTCAALGKRFGISHSQVSGIFRGKQRRDA